MKKRTAWTAFLTCLALVMVLGMGVKPSLSYFTTYVSAQGGYPIELRSVEMKVRENYNYSAKEIQIENTGEDDCYVRVQLFADSFIGLSYSGENWHQEGDWWYYALPIAPGELTSMLTAAITREEGMDQDYNVIVVSECAPIMRNADGTLPANNGSYSGWNLRAEVA